MVNNLYSLYYTGNTQQDYLYKRPFRYSNNVKYFQQIIAMIIAMMYSNHVKYCFITMIQKL